MAVGSLFAEERSPAPRPTAPAASPRPHFIPVDDESTAMRKRLRNETAAFLRAGNFAALDAMARDFRAKPIPFADGYWPLSLFYRVVADLEDDDATTIGWENRMTLLRRWFEEDPDSITARVSMAMALTYYAWFARGSGSAALVSPEGWNLVEERVSDASRILKAAHDLPEKCPGWYTAWMVKAMLGGDLASYPAVFGEAIHDFPGYTPFYFMGAWRLQERWYGRPGQWQAFATNAADEAGGEAGDILYARIVWYVRSFHFFSNPIADPGLDWPRVKRGFEAIRRQYPDSLLALSEYCSICRFAPSGGPELMRKLFGEIGDRVDLGVWPTMDNFLQNRQWAFSH